MRSNWVLRIGLPVLSLMAFAAMQSFASAQSPAAKGEHHELLHQLRHAHHLLTKADHDYDGHRVAAAEMVHKAIKELEGEHAKKAGGGKGAGKGHEKADHEPQMTSDEQMKEALSIVTKAETELHGKHHKAAEHLAGAIKEINVALGIR